MIFHIACCFHNYSTYLVSKMSRKILITFSSSSKHLVYFKKRFKNFYFGQLTVRNPKAPHLHHE